MDVMQPTEDLSGRPAGFGGPGRVHEATRLLREFLDVSAEFERSLGSELSVNPTDLEAMEHLLMSGPLSPGELARRLRISTASMTTSIDRLVALGHVSREPDAADRRRLLVVPHPASRERAMARIVPMIMDVDAELDEFDVDERDAITRYLRRVVDLYREHAVERSAPPAEAGVPGA
jgi:DNA-binding MarR family transcriptional regulator